MVPLNVSPVGAGGEGDSVMSAALVPDILRFQTHSENFICSDDFSKVLPNFVVGPIGLISHQMLNSVL